MTPGQYSRFALFTVIGAVLWLGFLPFYDWLFSWTEHVPGINWVYLPHGVRMMLVLLLGAAGALASPSAPSSTLSSQATVQLLIPR